jgi:hypothetical protein
MFRFYFLILISLGGFNAKCEVQIEAADFIPERRETPSIREFGYLVFPVLSVIPGVGTGFGAGSLVSNFLDSRAAFTGILTLGDFSTAVLSVTGIGKPDDGFSIDVAAFSTRIPFQFYERGVDGNSNQYFTQINAEAGGSVTLNANYWQKRLNFSSLVGVSRISTAQVNDPEGTRFDNFDNATTDSVFSTTMLQLDLTDSYIDPRRGFRLEEFRSEDTVFDGLHARFATYDTVATAYVPVGEKSTWAFNYFRGWASMISDNTLSAAQLQKSLSLRCGSTESASRSKCQKAEDARVQSRAAENKYGTAPALGAPMQMRAFPLGRFKGNQSLMYGSEFRLNFGNEKSNFDYGVVSGSLMAVQLAFFGEAGSAADSPANVESSTLRTSYGLGLRLGFSGSIVRADIAMSNEGPQFTFFLGYPWGLSPF